MSSIMRKHRRSILVVVVIVAGFPLVFAGVGGFGSGGNPRQANQDFPQSVGQVGPVPLSSAAFLREYNNVVQNRTQNGQEPDPQQLVMDGTVDQILERMINDALIQMEIQQRGYAFERNFLVDQLKDYQDFKNEAGQFDPALWNQFVSMGNEVNWNQIYTNVSENVGRQLYMDLMSASARVLDKELREEYRRANTTIRVKSAAIEPPVELTEEELRTHYEENQERYKTPEKRIASFVEFPLKRDVTAEAESLIERARGGEDFAALAREHSQGPEAEDGGMLGWVVETTNTPDHRKPLFQMETEEVSGPIEGPEGVYIYKITADRTSNVAGKRDVRARQILLRPSLPPDEKAAKLDVAEGLATLAEESGDLKAVAEEEGFEVQTTDAFSNQATEIENVVEADALTFRREAAKLEAGAVSGVIEANENAYVVQVDEVIAPEPQSFEEARERVETAAINAHKQTPEYRERVDELVAEIKENVSSLDELKEAYPELDVEIVETKAFKQDDFLFSDGIYWTPRDVYSLVEDAEIGEMVGPVTDFRQTQYFIELMERNEPESLESEEQWQQEREQLADTQLMTQRFERQQDYLQHLREQADENYMIQEDMAAVARVIGLEDETVQQELTTEGEGAESGEGQAGQAGGAGMPDIEITEGAPGEGGDTGEAPMDVLDLGGEAAGTGAGADSDAAAPDADAPAEDAPDGGAADDTAPPAEPAPQDETPDEPAPSP